jgi:hypothetical protein
MESSKENLSFGERTKSCYKKAIAEQGMSIQDRFKSIIEEFSSQGAAGLQVWWDNDYNEEIKVTTKRIRYHGLLAKVYIDHGTVDFSQICRWLSEEGFTVDYWGDTCELAGYIMWDK